MKEFRKCRKVCNNLCLQHDISFLIKCVFEFPKWRRVVLSHYPPVITTLVEFNKSVLRTRFHFDYQVTMQMILYADDVCIFV